jgi:hypothetical protein
MQRR